MPNTGGGTTYSYGSGVDARLHTLTGWCPDDECGWEGTVEVYTEDPNAEIIECPDCGTWVDIRGTN